MAEDNIVSLTEFARLKYEGVEGDLNCTSGVGSTGFSGDRAGYIYARKKGLVADSPQGMQRWLDAWGAASGSRPDWARPVVEAARAIPTQKHACSSWSVREGDSTTRAEAIANVVAAIEAEMSGASSPPPTQTEPVPVSTDVHQTTVERVDPIPLLTEPLTTTETVSPPSERDAIDDPTVVDTNDGGGFSTTSLIPSGGFMELATSETAGLPNWAWWAIVAALAAGVWWLKAQD